MFQNQGIGQEALKLMFEKHSDVHKWTLGTPNWAVRNHHFYERVGFKKVLETEVSPELGWSSFEYELVR